MHGSVLLSIKMVLVSIQLSSDVCRGKTLFFSLQRPSWLALIEVF